MQPSPANAIRRLRASPIPHGMTTVAGQSGEGISSDGMMLTTNPPAFTACSAAILVAGLPHPLTTLCRIAPKERQLGPPTDTQPMRGRHFREYKSEDVAVTGTSMRKYIDGRGSGELGEHLNSLGVYRTRG